MSEITTLHGKKIVLGVAGGIAAYKAVEVSRRLVDAGALVFPVLTEAAQRFVGEVTFSALGSQKAKTSLWDDDDPIPHTRLGQVADAIVVAPATADLIARYAHGLANDLLTTTLIATRAPVIVVAAMHTEMWEHPSVVENVSILRSRGVVVIDPESGRLAGGDVGVGRLASTDMIISELESVFSHGSKAFLGKKVLVTAGGTREAIDPVRYIGNRSSGKQGIAFARRAAELGARVTLVSTVDTALETVVEVVSVESAQEMYDVVTQLAPDYDLVVMAAAVADFRPNKMSPEKLKKRSGVPQVFLEATPDLLAYLGSIKPISQLLVGFAAETGDLEAEAKRKLEEKNADFIVANDVLQPDAGFSVDTNRVTVVGKGSVVNLELADKKEIADKVLAIVADWALEKGIWSQ